MIKMFNQTSNQTLLTYMRPFLSLIAFSEASSLEKDYNRFSERRDILLFGPVWPLPVDTISMSNIVLIQISCVIRTVTILNSPLILCNVNSIKDKSCPEYRGICSCC